MKNTKQQKIDYIKSKKQELIALSRTVKASACIDGDTINDKLIELYKQNTGNKEFKTYKQWKLENKIVKKGEKGHMVWSKPIKNKEKIGDEDKTEGFSFFSIAYVFGDKQVE